MSGNVAQRVWSNKNSACVACHLSPVCLSTLSTCRATVCVPCVPATCYLTPNTHHLVTCVLCLVPVCLCACVPVTCLFTSVTEAVASQTGRGEKLVLAYWARTGAQTKGTELESLDEAQKAKLRQDEKVLWTRDKNTSNEFAHQMISQGWPPLARFNRNGDQDGCS